MSAGENGREWFDPPARFLARFDSPHKFHISYGPQVVWCRLDKQFTDRALRCPIHNANSSGFQTCKEALQLRPACVLGNSDRQSLLPNNLDVGPETAEQI